MLFLYLARNPAHKGGHSLYSSDRSLFGTSLDLILHGVPHKIRENFQLAALFIQLSLELRDFVPQTLVFVLERRDGAFELHDIGDKFADSTP